jgi:anaerobic ribonucleoside-triphosphate reductase activating protein
VSEYINVAGLIGDSIVDGPGLRFTVFVQGCPHHCPGCHNPESWAFEGGTPMTPEDIFTRMKKNPLLTGVTFSGGEPFCQAAALTPLAKMVRENGWELAIYSGYTFEQLLSDPVKTALLRYADTLIDSLFVLAQRDLTLKYKGSRNQRVIDVQSSLKAGTAVLNTTERWN